MKRIILAFVLLGVFTFRICPAAEIDSITPRDLALDDGVAAINDIINARIEEGIGNANAQRNPDAASSCDEETLHIELRKAIFQSVTASWGLKGYDLDRQLRTLLARHGYSLSLNDSIYRDINYLEGFSLKLKELSDVVTLDGHLIGLDKLGHFFAQGWQYFELTDQGGKPLAEAMAWGREKETGLYGYTTTGIFSYADLVANLNGWRFWNKVLLKQDDPFKGFIARLLDRPHVSCDIQIIDSIRHMKIIRAWELNARFDLADYIDGAWDEANNCNSYADPMIEEKVTARIQQVDPGFSCPLNANDCRDARDKYGNYAKYVLHPYCLTR